jgi:hypothetical protein
MNHLLNRARDTESSPGLFGAEILTTCVIPSAREGVRIHLPVYAAYTALNFMMPANTSAHVRAG